MGGAVRKRGPACPRRGRARKGKARARKGKARAIADGDRLVARAIGPRACTLGRLLCGVVVCMVRAVLFGLHFQKLTLSNFNQRYEGRCELRMGCQGISIPKELL